MLWQILLVSRKVDTAYITISESYAGNIKDLLIYTLLGKLRKRTVIHLHGGSFRKSILERSFVLRWLNKHFLKTIGAAIVCGESHKEIFDNLISPKKIHLIPNFAQDHIFLELNRVSKKFEDRQQKLRVIYISGMTEGKGYSRLLAAYEQLSESSRSRIQIDFAGKFDDNAAETSFLQRIQYHPNVNYHGTVSGDQKSSLFYNAHVFCLPTSFNEGQPISILEAYAAGCVVVTTARPGILDIFKPNENGYLIPSDDPAPIGRVLDSLAANFKTLESIATHNQKFAEENFRQNLFCERAAAVLEKI